PAALAKVFSANGRAPLYFDPDRRAAVDDPKTDELPSPFLGFRYLLPRRGLPAAQFLDCDRSNDDEVIALPRNSLAVSDQTRHLPEIFYQESPDPARLAEAAVRLRIQLAKIDFPSRFIGPWMELTRDDLLSGIVPHLENDNLLTSNEGQEAVR